MRLEAFAVSGRSRDVPMALREESGRLILDTVALFRSLYEQIPVAPRQDLAATAQQALARGVAELAILIARREGVRTIGLSGGVAYNDAISGRIRQDVEAAGFSFRTNERVPCGDGGVAFGQLLVAANAARARTLTS